MRQKKQMPGQHDGEYIEDYVKRAWESEPGLKAEFSNDFEAYRAFCRAEAAGQVRVIGKQGRKI